MEKKRVIKSLWLLHSTVILSACLPLLWVFSTAALPWSPASRTPILFSFNRAQKQYSSPSWGEEQLGFEKVVGPQCLHWPTELLKMSVCWHTKFGSYEWVSFGWQPFSPNSAYFVFHHYFLSLLILLSYPFPIQCHIFSFVSSTFLSIHCPWLSLVSSKFDPTLKLLLLFQLFLLTAATLYSSCFSVLGSW